MAKYKLVTTAKTEGVNEAAVKTAAVSAYPQYRVAKVEDLGDKWQIRLDLKVSDSKREAAPPPFLKEKDDAGDEVSDDADSDSGSSDPDADSDDDSASSESDDDKDSDKADKKPGEGEKKDPVKAIESIIGELKGLVDQIGGHATELKDKADKVDEIHELTKGNGDVDSMDAVPPVPPIDDAAGVGPTGGKPPVPPRKPPVPTGRAPFAGGPGVPGVFGSRQTEIVEHPITDDDGEYSFSDVEAAVKGHPDLADYVVVELKAVPESNVYVARLTRK